VPVAHLLDELRGRYPAERVFTEPARLAPYESDALTAFRARPEAVVLADSREEVIDLVRLCHREGVPFVARGSGTSLSGGSLPVEGGIVIGLNRLNRVLKIDPVDRVAVVQPGVINANVTAAAAEHGLFYAPDPSSQSVCTIGGNIAFNSGGAHCLKHGMTSNHVLAIEAVLPDGELVRLGTGGAEPAGPDWLGLFVGSEGLFGVALEVTLRLLPAPEATRTLLAAYPNLEAAGDAVAATIAAGILPVAMEIMDALAIRAAESSVKPGYPDTPALLIVELDGERDAVDADFERLEAVITSSGATEVRATQDADERALIWKGRKSAFSAVGWLSPDYIVQDGCVPRTRLGEALATIERLSERRGLRVANVFHAGDGNLHPLILFDGAEPGAVERAEALAGEILDLCVDLGGSITGEHGVGVEKRAFLPHMFGPEDLAVMRRLRSAIDPAELANRGKMLPVVDSDGHPPDTQRSTVVGLGTHSVTNVTIDERDGVAGLQEAMREAAASGTRVLPRGAGTKPPLSEPPEGAVALEVAGLRGVVQHEPGELTLTAFAGTPVRELEDVLAVHGQYLPFDPTLTASGATLGGVVAAGTSGSGRYRHGGVRDFVIGVRFLDGTGELISGGGRVVKNAAGFDLPKLLVGSLGRLGVIVQLTVKVLPVPVAWGTLRAETDGIPAALEAIARLSTAGLDLEAVDLEPPGQLWVRLGGPGPGLERRLARVASVIGVDGERFLGPAEAGPWAAARELAWAPSEASVVKTAITPRRVGELDAMLERAGAARRYGAGGHICWAACPEDEPLARLDSELGELGTSGVRLTGAPGPVLLGAARGGEFAVRARRGLDPDGAFAELSQPAGALAGRDD
jgi:glycolate oxidase